MNEHACSEEDVLCEPEAAGIAHLPTSAGTFSLRRAHYFTKTKKPLLAAEQLTVEQQQALIKLIREGDVGAKQKMIAHNMHLVVDFAKRYANSGPAPLDLVREGNQGLIHALEKFDPEGGSSFSAYAALCIRQHIERTITNQNNRTPTGASPNIPLQGIPSQVRPSLMPAVSLQRAA